MAYLARITKGFSGADLTEVCQRVSHSGSRGARCAVVQSAI